MGGKRSFPHRGVLVKQTSLDCRQQAWYGELVWKGRLALPQHGSTFVQSLQQTKEAPARSRAECSAQRQQAAGTRND